MTLDYPTIVGGLAAEHRVKRTGEQLGLFRLLPAQAIGSSQSLARHPPAAYPGVRWPTIDRQIKFMEHRQDACAPYPILFLNLYSTREGHRGHPKQEATPEQQDATHEISRGGVKFCG